MKMNLKNIGKQQVERKNDLVDKMDDLLGLTSEDKAILRENAKADHDNPNSFMNRHLKYAEAFTDALKNKNEELAKITIKQLQSGDYQHIDYDYIKEVYNEKVAGKPPAQAPQQSQVQTQQPPPPPPSGALHVIDVDHAKTTLHNAFDADIEVRSVDRRPYAKDPNFIDPFGEPYFYDYSIVVNKHQVTLDEVKLSFDIQDRVRAAREGSIDGSINKIDDVLEFEHKRKNNELPSQQMSSALSEMEREINSYHQQNNQSNVNKQSR